MQKKEALIIFAKAPQKGMVKTRLAASVGEDTALAVYKLLLQHTKAATEKLACDKYVFYADQIPSNDHWGNDYRKVIQHGNDLGEKMQNAFSRLFGEGYLRVVVIGSDCFELTEEILHLAFSLLDQNEMVIGPAADGGYYLIGMKGGLKDVFNGVHWSTEKVLGQTISQVMAKGYSYRLLPVLNDVDTVDDLPEELVQHLKVKR